MRMVVVTCCFFDISGACLKKLERATWVFKFSRVLKASGA